MPRLSLVLLVLTLSPSIRADDHAPPPKFDRIVIDDNFPAAYQVEVADINGDQKPDIIALGGSTVAWYENPSWKKRIITDKSTAPSVISSASRDLDGDGKAEVAIAYDFEMNSPHRGKLGLAIPGESFDDPWTFRRIADVPSIHRIRWASAGGFAGETGWKLVVAPIFGENAKSPTYDQDAAKLRVFYPGPNPKTDPWPSRVVAERPVIHAIEIATAVEPRCILTADNLGIAGFDIPNSPDEKAGSKLLAQTWASGTSGPPPNRGASEIHFGFLGNSRLGRASMDPRVLATIEPWHGSKVVLRYSLGPVGADALSDPVVLDDTLDGGHALWLTDIDNDGDDEIFAGHRGKGHRVSIYNFNGKTWDRTILDHDIAAQDLRGAPDFPGVVAVGGSTHNVIWYRPKTP